MCRTFCKKSGSDPPFEETVSDTAGTNDRLSVRGLTDSSSLKACPRPALISYGFFFGWAGGCLGWSGVCVGLCSRTIFPSQEMYALVISSRSFFRLNSISAILCSRVLCSSGIRSFLSVLAYYREVDSFLRELSVAVALKSLRCGNPGNAWDIFRNFGDFPISGICSSTSDNLYYVQYFWVIVTPSYGCFFFARVLCSRPEICLLGPSRLRAARLDHRM